MVSRQTIRHNTQEGRGSMSRNMIWTLKQIHLAIEQYGKMQMQHTDLTPTQAALLYYLLTHREQEAYGIQLHATLGISKSSISSTLKLLRKKGYLRMREEPSDDRKKQMLRKYKTAATSILRGDENCSGFSLLQTLLPNIHCNNFRKYRSF